MNRFSRYLAAILILMSPLLGAKEKPDILFIAVDDLNDWTGRLGGHPQAKTPNLDRLMARGLTFTNAHCVAPACGPSRAALMSGLRPYETGSYENASDSALFLKDSMTINRHLLANGYETVGGGKIYHNQKVEGRDDTWSDWHGFIRDEKYFKNVNGLNSSLDFGPVQLMTRQFGDHKITDWAIEKLNEPSEEPLFLAVGYYKPHLNWHVPQKYFDRFPLEEIVLPVVNPDDLDDIPPLGVKIAKPQGDHAMIIGAEKWAKAVQSYLATISFFDDQLGRLLDGLETSDRADEMSIVLWSDHGWHLGEKEHWRKFSLWEESTRSVLTIVAPEVATTGSETDAPVDFLSIFPTLCDLAGLEIPEAVKGPSLMPLLKNPAAEWEHVAVITFGRGSHSVRDERYRYIRYRDGSEELYDHEADPNEWTNLVGREEHRAIADRLALALPVQASEAKGLPRLKR